MMRRTSVLVIGLTLPSLLRAQTVTTLDSVLRTIDREHPLLASYTNRAAAMRASALGARAWKSPMVGGGLFMAPYPGQTSSVERGEVMLSVQQAIPNPSKRRAEFAWQQSKATLAEADRAVTRAQLRGDARRAYYSWIVVQQQRAIVRDDQQRLQTVKKLAEIRYQYARGALGNIYKADGRLGQLDNMLKTIDLEIDRYRIALNTVMNRAPNTALQLDTATRVPTFGMLFPDSLAPDTARLHAIRSDVRRLDLGIRTIELGIARQRAEARPEIELRFDHMIPRSSMMPNRFTLLGMVSIPFAPWSSGSYKAESQGMQIEGDAMRRERDAVLNEARATIATMMAELRSLDQQLTTSKDRIIPALRKNYETVLIAYEQNQAEFPLVLDAWETLNMAQANFITQLQQYARMVADYEQAMER